MHKIHDLKEQRKFHKFIEIMKYNLHAFNPTMTRTVTMKQYGFWFQYENYGENIRTL